MRPQDKDFPATDLDALEARHAREERNESAQVPPDRPRVTRISRPPDGDLPESQKWLDRLYAGNRVVREKKPMVFDHLRSVGPWMASIDNDPLGVLDGMSQTATMPAGFASHPVVRAYFEGTFGDTLLRTEDTTDRAHPAALALANALQRRLPGFAHVTFASSGAEANEKALALARRAAAPDANRVLAFEGSFHGRTLLALHATWNPTKREPFQISGYEVTFAPFPVWLTPGDEPADWPGFLAAAAEGGLDAFDAGDDLLLRREIECLRAVDAALASRSYFACIVEPMQSEGGDRYATGRFFRALRLVTRRHNVPLIFDEVQTGFGLSGPFAWHERFALTDAHGNPDVPDAVVFAKRAQVGAVMSRWLDPEPTAAHPASLHRGRIHLELLDATHAQWLEEQIQRRLGVIASTFPKLVSHPRGRGYAFAFDLPDAQVLSRYIAQRFYRGAVVFASGERTVRYRLSKAWTEHTLDVLFRCIHDTLEWIDDHPDEDPPAWASPRRQTQRSVPRSRVRAMRPDETEEVIAAVMDLEARIYEPARREPRERLEACLSDPDAIALLAEVDSGENDWQVVGFALAAPIERFSDIIGPDRDPMRGRNNTLYSVAITVERSYQRLGLGHVLKARQIELARARTDENGQPRFRYVSGRNRQGYALAMSALNRRFGGYVEERIENAYDGEGVALYFRIPLGPFVPEVELPHQSSGQMSAGVVAPFAQPPKSLTRAWARGNLFGPAIHKITLSNYVTPAIVRAMEYVDALAPNHAHLYLTSCRDEMVDKALRLIRWHRKQAGVAIGVDGGYVGHTSAAARSLSDPATHRQGPAHFDWPRIPHPADDEKAAEAALREAIAAAGGAERCFGLFIEPVAERTGKVVPDSFWAVLARIREDEGLPIVAIETATACWRSGRGPFYGSALDFVPDLIAWWGGGQVGFLHVTRPWFVDKPLAMISTWDGDELSLIRVHHQLRAARKVDVEALGKSLDAAVQPLGEAGLDVRGAGAYRVVAAGARAPVLQAALATRGLHVRRLPGGHLVLAPALDTIRSDVKNFAQAIREIL